METLTHINIQSLLFPNTSKKTLRAINHQLDHPTLTQRKLTSLYSLDINGIRFNMFDILGLGRTSGHRKWNHDFLMAMMLGYQNGGIQGMQVALLHLIQDFQASAVKKMYGRGIRDMWEAKINLNFAIMNEEKRRRAAFL